MSTVSRLRLRPLPGGELTAETNLNVNTISLIVSNGLTCVLGLFYWGVAARVFPADDVGIAAALINSALMLSTLSILSIDRFYERFLPVAGHRAAALVKQGFAIVAAVSMAGGIGLILLGPRQALFSSGWILAAYPLFVAVTAVFILQDKTLAGLGVARWAALKNTGLAIGKLIVLVVVATVAGAGALAGTAAASTAIVAAWGCTAAVIASVFFVIINRRCRRHPRFLLTPNLPPLREMWSYFGSSFGITAMLSTGALVVPLIVVAQVGPAANAYFQIAWQFVSALYLTIHLAVSPFVAEAAAHPDKIPELTRRAVAMLLGIACVGGAGLVLVAPPLLSLIGPEYRSGSADLLLLAALFIPLSVVGAAYDGFARVQRRLRLQLAMTFVWTGTVIGGSLILTRHLGVTGVGWAYLAAETLCAVVLIGPAIGWMTKGMHSIPAAGTPPADLTPAAER
ncbi:lipopolysaccharide biosynthesis protein [Mycolicibacterium vaccae]|uniref:lipopolysaccharide biosynthesis protein n=1 Tax=Mycolicibacterium vaccae TaxID=1810 RepID=UPI003CEC9443